MHAEVYFWHTPIIEEVFIQTDGSDLDSVARQAAKIALSKNKMQQEDLQSVLLVSPLGLPELLYKADEIFGLEDNE